jgi:hypothetical protein
MLDSRLPESNHLPNSLRAGRKKPPTRPISLNRKRRGRYNGPWKRFDVVVNVTRGLRPCIHSALAVLLLSTASYGLIRNAAWRQASDKELAGVIPARATVINERIETEMRTASGVTDGHGKFIAGVVMITAGYAAEGKYSYFLSTQVPIKIAGMDLKPGEYVFGSHRTDEQTLELKFYEAGTGKFLGPVHAIADKQRGPIRSLAIAPPESGKGSIKIGRFAFTYSLSD